jgi:hypothetical protein
MSFSHSQKTALKKAGFCRFTETRCAVKICCLGRYEQRMLFLNHIPACRVLSTWLPVCGTDG